MESYFSSSAQNAGFGFATSIPVLAIAALMVAAMWRVYEKAGEHGWAAIIPFYSNYIQFKIAFGNGWIFLVMLVPLVNIVFAFILGWKMAKAFGRGLGFAIGLALLPIVFYPILAFDDGEYFGVQE